MVLNRFIQKIGSEKLTKEGVKKLLSEVDDLVVGKNTTKNPSKLLQKKTDTVKVGDNEIKVGPKGEATEVNVKNIKVKQPETTKESIEEFFSSFQSNTVPKNILKDFNINKINSNDDIYKIIDAISKANRKAIQEQKRGIRTQGTTKAAGTRLMKDDDFLVNVLGVKAGQTLNAEQIYATRELLVAGLNRLNHLAKKAVDFNATADDVLTFRQHYALMAQIQKVLKGVQTETARALNQFKIPTRNKMSFIGGNVDDLNKDALMVELGGFDDIRQIAKLYIQAPADEIGKLRAVEGTGLKSFSMKVSDTLSEVFLNAILSNPLTHVRNSAGNWISQAIVQQERMIASRFFGGKNNGGVAAYEDIAKAWGKHMASKEIMAAMKDVYKLGGSKIETKLGQFTAQNYNIKNKYAAGMVDLLGKGFTLGNLPTKFLKVSDDFFKNREFRSEVYALSFAEGMEMYNKGLLPKEKLAQYIASRVANPTKEITDAAYKQAQYVTFQTPLGKRGDVLDIGKAAQTVKNYAGSRGPFSWFTNYYMPFVQTPTNIAGFVAERTPVLAQILTNYNAKIAAGGRTAEIAKAQLYLGSMFYLATAPLGYYGVTRGSDIRGASSKLTGGKNLIQKTTKKQPMQIEIPIGDGKFQTISFRGMDPVGQMLANSANFGQMLSMLQGSIYNNVTGVEDDNYSQLSKDALMFAIAFSFSIGENLSNSMFLSGAGKLVDDTNKIVSGFSGGEAQGFQALKEVGIDYATSHIPTIAREVGKLFNDDSQKLATEFKEYFTRNIAESDLEYDYDMRGRRYDKFNYFNQIERDYIDDELDRVFPKVTPVRNSIQYQYDNFGNQVSIPLKSAEKRFLRKNAGIYFDQKMKALMETDFYKNETRRQIKEGLIKTEWQDAKSLAKKALLSDIEYDDGTGGKVNYFQNIKTRAEELRNQEILNSQQGYINDNINNNN